MNRDQIAILRSEIHDDPLGIGYGSMTYEAIVASINAPGASVPNPVQQPTIPTPSGIIDILGALTNDERIAILGDGTFRDMYLRLIAVGSNPTADAVMGFVAMDSEMPFETVTNYSLATRLVELQQTDLLAALALLLVQDGKLTMDTAAALQELLARTQLDPRWPPTIPTPSRREALGLPVVRSSDVQLVF